MEVSKKIRGVKSRKQWAVFAPDGYIQYRTIADTKKEAQESAPLYGSNTKWADYAAAGYTVSKVLVDIKLL